MTSAEAAVSVLTAVLSWAVGAVVAVLLEPQPASRQATMATQRMIAVNFFIFFSFFY